MSVEDRAQYSKADADLDMICKLLDEFRGVLIIARITPDPEFDNYEAEMTQMYADWKKLDISGDKLPAHGYDFTRIHLEKLRLRILVFQARLTNRDQTTTLDRLTRRIISESLLPAC